MDHKALLTNIEALLRAKKVSADAISKKAGRIDAIRNLRRRVAGEFQGSWTLDTLNDVAAALDVEPWELLRPPGGIPQDAKSREFVRSIIREEMGLTDQPAKRKKG